MSRVAQQMAVTVSTAGELVVLQLGNLALCMHFADAFKVAHNLLNDGRTARRAAVGRIAALLPSVRALGSLTDATAEKVAPSRWRAALPERYKASEIWTRPVGSTVELKLRNIIATLPFDAALSISQWLRVRGKEARNSVNEKAGWADIAQG